MTAVLAAAALRDRLASLLATLAAVVVGTALLAASLLVAGSLRPDVAPRLACAAVLVAAPTAATDRSVDPGTRIAWSPAETDRLAVELGRLAGAAGAVVDRSFHAQARVDGRPVGDPDDDEAGHGWASTRLGPAALVAGRAPGSGEVVVDRALGVAPGTALTVDLASGPAALRVAGLVDGPALYVDDATAARLAPGVTTIGLLAEPGTDPADLAAAAAGVLDGRGVALAGDARGEVEPGWRAHVRYLGEQVVTALVALALFTAVLVVAATLAVALAGRRRELALLRVLGADPARLRRLVLAESAGLGLVGGLLGALGGIALAPAVAAALTALEATPPGFALRVAWPPLLLAVAVGPVVTVAGTAVLARRAARVPPFAALGGDEHADPRRRGGWRGGAIAGGAGLALVLAAALADGDGRLGFALAAAMALVVAAALLAPRYVGPLAALVTAPWARSGSPTVALVRGELRAAPVRAAGTAAPVIAAVGFAVLLSGLVATMNVAYPASQADRLAGQVMVSPDGTPGLTDAALRDLGAPLAPGTRASLPTVGFVGDPAAAVATDVVGSVDPTIVGTGEVVLSEQAAAALAAPAGATLPIRFADGTTVPLRVARVLPLDPARGDVTVTRDTVRRHDPSALGDEYYVPAAAAPERVGPGAVLRDARSFVLADYETDARVSAGLVGLLVVVSVLYGALAAANGLVVAVRARRGDLAVLRRAGASRTRVATVVAAETAVVVGLGALAGVVVPLAPLVAVASGLARATATDVGLHLDAVATVGAVVAALVLLPTTAAVVAGRSTELSGG